MVYSRVLFMSHRCLAFVLVIVYIFNQPLDCTMPAAENQEEPRLLKRSPPIFVPLNQVHFPQQQQLNSIRQSQVPPLWGSDSLSEPANIPNPLSQEDARYLEQYMRNTTPDERPLNLASTNHRTNKPVARKMADPSSPVPARQKSVSPPLNDPMQLRADLGYPAQINNRHDDMFARKGKVDDVIVTKHSNQRGTYVQPVNTKFKQNLVQSFIRTPILNKFQENCITRSAQQAGMCEDHLIKRLTQDATEGRSVIDVGRRVCCALFWHKECIDSIVLKACPDSTPVAADYILGARKIDLATSCQRFNREGCNGSPKASLALANMLPIMVSIFVLLT